MKRPFVSIVMPCRNEIKFIAKCLDSILKQDYPKNKIEIIIADGMSEDGTRKILKQYGKKYKYIKILDNHKKLTPIALNLGIKKAKGEIIVRMDAHAYYKRNYVSKCIYYLEKTQADNIGGRWKIISRNNTILGKSIAFAFSNKFGTGNAHYKLDPRIKQKLREVDTVPFGCYKKEIFKKIGMFNENLKSTQDMEFNKRLKRAGGRILLLPEIIGYYYSRSSLKDFLRHNFTNGIAATLPFKYAKMPVSFRHLVPLFFVLYLMLFSILSVFHSMFLVPLTIVLWLYILTSIYFSAKIAAKEKKIIYFFVMPLVFFLHHVSYGLGSIIGVIKWLF